MKTVGELITALSAFPLDMPVVATMGIGEPPQDPGAGEQIIWFDAAGEPTWVTPAADPRPISVIWL